MKQVTANKWQGEVYNAKNGRMYSASVTLVSDDVIKIEGCVLGGLLCGGENWTRHLVNRTLPTLRPRDKQAAPGAKPKDNAAASREVCHDG